uniref:Uncharacterized protein n=1 Tax=Fagus sylvatica TaxID=28930 RepID=A0A2N9G4P4_FAGSY
MMEAILIDCVQNSLRHFMHRNDIFICERLCAQFPSERIGDRSFSNSGGVFVSQGYGVSRERGEREESGNWASIMAESKKEK